MIRYEEFKAYKDRGIDCSAEKQIEEMIKFLITILFVPDETAVSRVDGEKVDKLGFGDEPINWGNFPCVDVEKRGYEGNQFTATIDEADPNCPNLHKYLSDWLAIWGWDVKIITEW